jgi:hypothetical protein
VEDLPVATDIRAGAELVAIGLGHFLLHSVLTQPLLEVTEEDLLRLHKMDYKLVLDLRVKMVKLQHLAQ